MSVTTTYAPSPVVLLGFEYLQNPDAYVGKTVTDTFAQTTQYILGRYGTKVANRVDHVIFTRFEVDVPKGATVTGVKIEYHSNGGVGGTDDIDISGGFVLPDNDWEDSTGVLEWGSYATIPLAQSYDGPFQDATEHPEVFQDGAPAFDAVTTELVSTLFQEYSFGDGLTAITSVTGLVDQLQNYIDEHESLRDHVVAGSIPVLVQLYGDWIVGDDNHYQGLIQADYVGSFYLANRPSLTVEYTPAVTAFSLLGLGTSTHSLAATGLSVQAIQGAAVSIYYIEGTATSVLSLIGDSVSTITLEGGQMKTGQDITYVRGDDVIINVTVSLDESRTLDGSETWKWNLKRGVDSHSSLAKTSAGGTITVDGTTKQPTIVIAASDFPTNTFPASVVDQLYTHELQMTKSSKVETVTRGRFTLQSDIVI